MKSKKQTIGFWDKGKGTTLTGCASDGFDIGLKSDGEDLMAENFKATRDGRHFLWHEKWWIKYLVLPFVVTIAGFLVSFYFKLN